jgi:hypothetical protein
MSLDLIEEKFHSFKAKDGRRLIARGDQRSGSVREEGLQILIGATKMAYVGVGVNKTGSDRETSGIQLSS